MMEEAGIARSNYLVLRDRHGKYHLNGNWKLDPEGVYNIGGTKFIYRRPYNYPESLAAEGPLLDDLVLEVNSFCLCEIIPVFINKHKTSAINGMVRRKKGNEIL